MLAAITTSSTTPMNSSCSATVIPSPGRLRTMPTQACIGPGGEETTSQKMTTRRTRPETTECKGRCAARHLNDLQNPASFKSARDGGYDIWKLRHALFGHWYMAWDSVRFISWRVQEHSCRSIALPPRSRRLNPLPAKNAF